MSRLLSIGFVLVALTAPAAAAEARDAAAALPAGAERTESGPGGAFSITFPSSWRSESTSQGDYHQLALFADRPLDVSIVIGSRPLDDAERALEPRALLDRMIELTMINTTELGNEIVQVGRVEPLVGDWPAFAAVATTPDRAKMITILRSFVGDRAYVVTTVTDNLQASPELGATIDRVVGSLTVRPPGAAAERTPEALPRSKRFCFRW